MSYLFRGERHEDTLTRLGTQNVGENRQQGGDRKGLNVSSKWGSVVLLIHPRSQHARMGSE